MFDNTVQPGSHLAGEPTRNFRTDGLDCQTSRQAAGQTGRLLAMKPVYQQGRQTSHQASQPARRSVSQPDGRVRNIIPVMALREEVYIVYC